MPSLPQAEICVPPRKGTHVNIPVRPRRQKHVRHLFRKQKYLRGPGSLAGRNSCASFAGRNSCASFADRNTCVDPDPSQVYIVLRAPVSQTEIPVQTQIPRRYKFVEIPAPVLQTEIPVWT
ncbi:hypothetical protein C8R44DRAFT_730900 [Mycena epipterygia]|nr:hypothetical protein C8R44DRAFT_730900 [Mycena epipterygia]